MQIVQKVLDGGADSAPRVLGSVRGADVVEANSLVAGQWDLTFLQLEPGHLEADFDFLMSDGMLLYQETFGRRVHTNGSPKPGTIAMGMPGDSSETGNWWGRSLPRDQLPFGSSCGEIEVTTLPGETRTILSMDESRFRSLFFALSGCEAEFLDDGCHFIRMRAGGIERLRSQWREHITGAIPDPDHPFKAVDLIAGFTDCLFLPVSAGRTGPDKAGIVRRSIELAESEDYRLTVAEISVRLRISKRTIEYAFIDHLGIPPKTYLKFQRLGQCREALVRADPNLQTVAGVAREHGFHETGRFSGNYRKFFGELPSETLRRAERPLPAFKMNFR